MVRTSTAGSNALLHVVADGSAVIAAEDRGRSSQYMDGRGASGIDTSVWKAGLIGLTVSSRREKRGCEE